MESSRKNDKSEKKTDAEKFGHEAEQIAMRYLLCNGYTIREMNWKPSSGRSEIDIIAEAGNTMVFVEVKARNGKSTDPVDAVDNRKMVQMVKGADAYLGGISRPYFYRFDIIAITGNAQNYTLQHLQDAFISPISCR